MPAETGIAAAITTAKKVDEALGLVEKVTRFVKRQRYPKAKRRNVGILIAIETEDTAGQNIVKNDFLKSLQELLSAINVRRPFELIELPDYHLESIKTKNDAGKIMLKCQAKFMLWGIVKTRTLDGKSYLVFDIRSLVAHGVIVQSISDVLGSEMAHLLPRRVLVSKENDLLEVEFSAQNTGLAARYIIAEASFLSGDVDYALELFEELKVDLSGLDISRLPEQLSSHIVAMRDKVKVCLTAIHLQLSAMEHLKWRKTRSNDALEAMIEHARQADSHIATYQTAVNWSLYHFVKGDIPRARKSLDSWKGGHVKDGTWALNLAFLFLFEGKLREANRYYKVAFRRELSNITILEVEEFMEWSLSENPDKTQIYYGLGMINYFAKNEQKIASEYFQKFIDSTPAGLYKEQAEQVKKYLLDIQGNKPLRLVKKI